MRKTSEVSMKNKKPKYRRVDLPELQSAFEMKSNGQGIREIASALKRSPGTIHKWFNNYKHYKKSVWSRLSSCQRAKYVYDAMKAKRHLKRRTPIRDVKRREYVIERLVAGDSPELISATMAEDKFKKVCFKTIYNLTKYDRGLKKYLYEKGKKRRQKVATRRIKHKEAAPKVVSIHTRSKTANERLEFGHLEADLICTCRFGSYSILSLIERQIRKKWFVRIPDTKSKTVTAYLIGILTEVPSELVRSLTLDNGPEFAYSEIIKLQDRFPGLDVYYCDPYKSFQKGAIERANRDFRYYHPKGTDFVDVTKAQVKDVQKILNNKRLKCLDYATPNQLWELQLEYAQLLAA